MAGPVFPTDCLGVMVSSPAFEIQAFENTPLLHCKLL